MEYLVSLSLATAIGWEIVRYFTPFDIPARIAPLVVIGIAYGFTQVDNFNLLLAFAAAGGVAIFHRITNAGTPEVIQLPKFNRKNKTMPKSNRIPDF